MDVYQTCTQTYRPIQGRWNEDIQRDSSLPTVNHGLYAPAKVKQLSEEMIVPIFELKCRGESRCYSLPPLLTTYFDRTKKVSKKNHFLFVSFPFDIRTNKNKQIYYARKNSYK